MTLSRVGARAPAALLALVFLQTGGCGPAEPPAAPTAAPTAAPADAASVAAAAPPPEPSGDPGVECSGDNCRVSKVTPATAAAIKAFSAAHGTAAVLFQKVAPEGIALLKELPETKSVWWSGSSKDGPVDLAPLAGLKNLTRFTGENATLTSLAPLAGLPLSSVTLRQVHGLTDFTPLSTLKQLDELGFEKSGLTSVGPIVGLGDLTVLRIEEEHDVGGLEGLSALTKLRTLRLWGVGPVDLGFVSSMPDLRELSLSRDKVKSLDPLKGAASLRELALIDADLVDVKALRPLTGLTSLALTGNKRLKDIQPIANLKALREVYLIATGVSSLAPLAKLPDLERVLADRSKVTSIAPLVGMTKLQEVSAPKGIKPAEIDALKKKSPDASVRLY